MSTVYDKDGNPEIMARFPREEPDWGLMEAERHSLAAHAGGACNCPEPPRRAIELAGDFPDIVALCGSTRFPDAFRQANLRLTLKGAIVLTVGCDLRSDADLAAAGELGEDIEQVKARLDDLHREKILLADMVLVVSDESGYFGDSTASEIFYANENGKPVSYLHRAALERAEAMGLTVEEPF